MISCRAVGREEGLPMRLLADKWTYHSVDAGCKTHDIHPDLDTRGEQRSWAEYQRWRDGWPFFQGRNLTVACEIDLEIFSDPLCPRVFIIRSSARAAIQYYGIIRWKVVERRRLLRWSETIVATYMLIVSTRFSGVDHTKLSGLELQYTYLPLTTNKIRKGGREKQELISKPRRFHSSYQVLL